MAALSGAIDMEGAAGLQVVSIFDLSEMLNAEAKFSMINSMLQAE